MKLDELKSLLQRAGVVGAGGAGFPSYAKLSDKADTVVLNCSECEPLLKLHRQVLEEYAHEIVHALKEIVTAVGAERGIIAVKKHYEGALRAVSEEILGDKQISVHALRSVYPAGDELILIKEVTGRCVPVGELPISVGVTVFNVETALNVYRALNGHPVTHKFVTIAGEVKNPITVRVPIGTGVADMIKAAGGATCDDFAVISGGPMMGRVVSVRDTVTKTTNAIIVLPKGHNVILNKTKNPKISLKRAMSVCCQCRSCTELCSRHVLGYPVEPHTVMRVLSNGGKGYTYKLAGSLYCSGCGLCESYSCPQDLSPRALIAQLKSAARAQGITPPKDFELESVKDADYKKVSVERLTSRLGLKRYDLPAPISEIAEAKAVKLLLSQHIGAPAVCTVKEGDTVRRGDPIADAKDGALSVPIHASIDGKISEITEKYIKIVN